MSELAQRSRDDFRRDHLGVVNQDPGLLDELSIAENISLIGRFRPYRGAARRPDVGALLSAVGLAGRGEERPTHLSGGEAQRVAVARAAASAVSAVIADEPTASLDRGRSDEIISLLLRLTTSANVPLIVATHDLAIAARCDAVLDLGLDR